MTITDSQILYILLLTLAILFIALLHQIREHAHEMKEANFKDYERLRDLITKELENERKDSHK